MPEAFLKRMFTICCYVFLGLFLMGCVSKPAARELPIFGEERADTIRVTIKGYVNRPGIYHVPQGTNVAGLIELAMGRKLYFPGEYYYIIRENSSGQRERIDFRGSSLTEGLELFKRATLKEGDDVNLDRRGDIFL